MLNLIGDWSKTILIWFWLFVTNLTIRMYSKLLIVSSLVALASARCPNDCKLLSIFCQQLCWNHCRSFPFKFSLISLGCALVPLWFLLNLSWSFVCLSFISLWLLFDVSSISLRFLNDIASLPRWFIFDFCHVGLVFSLTSLWFVFGFSLISSRLLFYLSLIYLSFFFSFSLASLRCL